MKPSAWWGWALLLGVPLAGMAETPAGEWPAAVEKVEYDCTADNSRQKALFYAPKRQGKLPLLVGLHTWSSGYAQGGATQTANAEWCIAKEWVFIQPDFRGPNKRPEATGSELAVRDIVDAVAYARQRADVDPDRIYLIGASGGGYAALLMLARHPELWAGVSAWVPIWDLKQWHGESLAKNRRYYKDIEASCGGAPGSGAEVDEQYRRRSPSTYLGKGPVPPLDLNTGIRDGHAGSVPVSHSLRAFNALALEKDRFSEDDIGFIDREAKVPTPLATTVPDFLYGDRQPLLRRVSGSTRLTVFNGKHEIISLAGLAWLEQQRKGQPARWTVELPVGVRLTDEAESGK